MNCVLCNVFAFLVLPLVVLTVWGWLLVTAPAVALTVAGILALFILSEACK